MQRVERCRSYENCYCTIPTESSYLKWTIKNKDEEYTFYFASKLAKYRRLQQFRTN
jgi:hypothetical protein